MADKKKLSVAEILAAARKTDGAKAPGDAPEAEKPAAAAPEASAAAEKPAKPAKPAAKPAAAKPAAGGARMSVAEMLAAARAEKEAGAAPAAKAEKPAAPVAKEPVKKEVAKAAPKPAAAAAPAAPAAPKDTGSILAEARNAVKPGPMSKAEAAAKAPAAKPEKPRLVVPPMPVKPEYAKPKPKAVADEGRRGFLMGVMLGSFLGIGFSSLGVTFSLWGLGLARFMFPNVLTEPPSKFKVGFPSGFAPGQVETKFIPQFGVWVVNWEYNGKSQIYALRSVCTHLGCTPNWLEGEQKFKCPCHGSGFYKDGINFEGPAPRPLERYAIRVADDGQLEIDKSKIFQEEIGQWSDPASFVAV